MKKKEKRRKEKFMIEYFNCQNKLFRKDERTKKYIFEIIILKK